MSAPGYPPAPDYPSQSYPPPPQPHPWGPFTAGDLLRRTFQIYREYFVVFLGISAVATVLGLVVQLPMQILPFALGMHQPTPDPSRAIGSLLILFPLGILTAVIGMYIYALTYGAMFCAVADIRQSGRATVTRALEQTAPRSLRLLGAYLLAGLRIIGWLLLFCLVCVVLGVILTLAFHAGGMNLPTMHPTPGVRQNFAALGAAFVVFALLFLVAFIFYLFFLLWLYGRYLLFIPVVLAENAHANASVNRSVELSRHSKGRIYALLLTCFLLSLVGVAAAAPFFFLAIRGSMHGAAASPIISMAEVIVIAIVQMLLMHPVLGIGISLCYFDLRARKDAAPVVPPPLPTPAAWQPLPPLVVQPDPVVIPPAPEPPPSSPVEPLPPPPPATDPEPQI